MKQKKFITVDVPGPGLVTAEILINAHGSHSVSKLMVATRADGVELEGDDNALVSDYLKEIGEVGAR